MTAQTAFRPAPFREAGAERHGLQMGKIFYKPENAWFGDAIPFYDNGVFYIYYLHDERKTAATADHTSWHLVCTKDFVHWEEAGETLPAGGRGDPDQACYTGSVMRGRDGDYHLFYTGQNPLNPDFGREGKPLQYILHAVSRDLKHWEKHYETAFCAPEGVFEPHDWRDPYVFYEEESGTYDMLLAARLKGKSFRRSGCVALCRSKDLWNWQRGEIFFAPGMYYTHECPDLFRQGQWWYLLYSTFTTRFATHYRKAKSVQGPWKLPEEDCLDARGLYAIKTASDGQYRYGFGWIPTRHGDCDQDYWEWGGTLAVHEIYQLANGDLAERLPHTIEEAFGKGKRVKPFYLEDGVLQKGDSFTFSSENTAWALFDGLPRQGLLEARFCWQVESRPVDFGIGVQMEEGRDEGYFFRFEPGYNRLVFDLWPRGDTGKGQHRMGGDIPFVPAFERRVDYTAGDTAIRLLIEDDICVIYVNDRIAMSARVCCRKENWGFFVTGGTAQISDISWRTLKEN